MPGPIKLTCDHGTALLRAAFFTVWPEKVGAKEFSAAERSSFSDELEALAKLLKGYSPLMRGQGKGRPILFGPASNYEKKEKTKEELDVEARRSAVPVSLLEKTYWDIKDSDLEVEIVPKTTHRRAIYRLLYLWPPPDSKVFLPPKERMEFLWPLAELLGKDAVAQLRKDIGLEDKKTWDVPVGADEESPAPVPAAPETKP